jgi:putative (di)nucleoside polyphosphate hydrolase
LPLADNLWDGKYRGQTQRWLLFYFSGLDDEINIKTTNPEFKNWVWLKPSKLPEKAISFKKNVYMKINEIFIPILDNFISSNIK